jgi:hypothetical protein
VSGYQTTGRLPVRRTLLGAALMLILIAPDSPAQTSRVINTLRTNQQELKRYDWRSRVGGAAVASAASETDSRWLFRVHADASGRRVRTLVDTEQSAVAPNTELIQWIESYTQMPAERIQVAFALAAASEENGTDDPRLHIRLQDVLQPGDSIDVWLDPETFRPRKFEIVTSLDDQELVATAEFTDLPDGPTYAARTIVTSGSDSLERLLEIDNFDFVARRK